MPKATKKEKELWNKAVKATLSEVAKYDGLIPQERDRRLLVDQVLNRVSYKSPEINLDNIKFH